MMPPTVGHARGYGWHVFLLAGKWLRAPDLVVWVQPAFRMTFPLTMVVLPWYVSPLSQATL